SKIREKVNDPDTAELLTPRGYPLFAKRPPLDHGFYEAFNRDNVKLVDIKHREPIVAVTSTGLKTTEQDYEFDIIVLATGFKAYTGALEAIEIRNSQGATLSSKWQETSASIMGVCAVGFPNLFIITGPQAPFANLPTSIEQNIKWITDCVRKMEQEEFDIFTPQQAAEDAWAAHRGDTCPDADGGRLQGQLLDDGCKHRGQETSGLNLLRRRRCVLRQAQRIGRCRIP
ncbi:MAG: hypothetical protein ACPHE0_08370, partial [Pseudomonadales bacterium]